MRSRFITVIALSIATVSAHHAQSAAYFSATDTMASADVAAPAVTLADGTVLLVADGSFTPYPAVYDPTSGRFSLVGAMIQPRSDSGAVRLADGRVLVAGGWDGSAALASAELYDPAAHTFSTAGALLTPRTRAAVACLNDGRVLIAGGSDGTVPLASAEIYDPATAVSTPAGDMTAPRIGAAVPLANGRVLIVAGTGDTADASADVYDPATNSFSATGSLSIARRRAAATLLADGRVLVTGGADAAGNPVAQAEVYDAASGAFRLTGAMNAPRFDHRAIAIGDGSVLAVGGRDASSFLASAERYDPATGTFTVDAPLLQPRATPIAAPLADGGALLAGGIGADAAPLATAERYWSARRADTVTTLSASAASSIYGQPVTYTASVTSASAVPDGVVQFLDGGTAFAEATLVAGRASVTSSTTPAGTRAISAVYLGSTAFNRSQSAAVTESVAQASATGTFTITPLQRQYSDPVTFSVTVSPAAAAQSVTFKMGTVLIGTADVKGGQATLTTPVLSTMTPGSRIITASFNQAAPNFVIPSINKSMSIAKEDARITAYSEYGTTVYTACSTCTTAKVVLEATVKDISVTPDANGDVWPGDIRKATVTFVNRTNATTLATVPVTLIDPAVSTTGEAVYEWTVDLGTASSKTFQIGYSVGGLYSRTSYDYFLVTVSRGK